MRLSEKERAVIRESFGTMTLGQKIEYVWSYYRLPISLAVIALAILCGAIYAQLTRREPLLYAAYANLSMGETLDEALNEGFVRATGEDPRRCEVYVYRNLYLSQDAATENHEYAYASQLKTLATIADQRFDVALMNREAYDLLSSSGYLLALPDLLARDEALAARLSPYLTQNAVILEDNAIEYHLNEADAYAAVTEEAVNGIDVTSFPLFARAGFSGDVYLGVIGNSPRLDTALSYIAYLTQATGDEL